MQILSQTGNCGFQFIFKDGSQTSPGTGADDMKLDVIPEHDLIRKILLYCNGSDMLVGLVFYDKDGKEIYKSRYKTGFGSDRKKQEILLAEDE